MDKESWELGICGTFDVTNYGDLLFPLIAEAELTERLGPVTLHRFSYYAKEPPEWPYRVTSLSELPELIHRLDGLLIGGGFLVRFDKEVAPGYFPPVPGIHHPTGYWLTPALLALQHNVPLIWNAPGMHRNQIPAWAAPLVEMALTHSRYVSVRDAPSGEVLQPLTKSVVNVVPDTAFRLPRLLQLEGSPSAEFRRLAEASGLDGPYIAIQAAVGLEEFVRFIEGHKQAFRDLKILALPISPVLGEREQIIETGLPGVLRLTEWPDPLVLAEVIARSQGVVGHSYHLMITALTCGVPVFTRQNMSLGKYVALSTFEGIFVLPDSGELNVEWFLSRIGKRPPCAGARKAHDLAGEHWDRIARALRADAEPTAPTLNRFWQSMPELLEGAAAKEVALTAVLNSKSWKLTALLRSVGRHIKRNGD